MKVKALAETAVISPNIAMQKYNVSLSFMMGFLLDHFV